MAVYLSDDLRARLEAADRRRCCYCLTTEANSGIPLTHDHIHPFSKGGQTAFENICLACRACNEFKADKTEAEDPLTGERTSLYHPRAQAWADHFQWSVDGTRVEGLTAIGRATIIALRLNNPTIVAARSRWVSAGWHPPLD